ncbi:MAG: epoxide hydrolase N-terminal domain-containing protein, partial [Acidobacteriota bacterium]
MIKRKRPLLEAVVRVFCGYSGRRAVALFVAGLILAAAMPIAPQIIAAAEAETSGSIRESKVRQKETNMSEAAKEQLSTPAADESIRPFKFRASDEALADLKKRIAATKWPNKELVNDATQGVQLGTMQKLADYWANKYDWRKVEARLDALPQFVTNI